MERKRKEHDHRGLLRSASFHLGLDLRAIEIIVPWNQDLSGVRWHFEKCRTNAGMGASF